MPEPESCPGTLTGLYHRLLSPRIPALIVSLREDGLPNVMVAAWHTPVSVNPPILAVAIAPGRFTHTLIERSGEFTVNIPDLPLLPKVRLAGSRSGAAFDKSRLFRYVPAAKVKAPVIGEAIGSIECRLNRLIGVGDHSIILGDVVHASARGFDGVWRSSSPLLHAGTTRYLGGEFPVAPD